MILYICTITFWVCLKIITWWFCYEIVLRKGHVQNNFSMDFFSKYLIFLFSSINWFQSICLSLQASERKKSMICLWIKDSSANKKGQQCLHRLIEKNFNVSCIVLPAIKSCLVSFQSMNGWVFKYFVWLPLPTNEKTNEIVCTVVYMII